MSHPTPANSDFYLARNKRKLLKLLTLAYLGIFFSSKIALSAFTTQEVEIRKQYESLKIQYEALGVDWNFIAGYRSSLMSSRDQPADLALTSLSIDSNVLTPWKNYVPSPKKWLFWEIGFFAREKLNRDLQERESWNLEIDDLAALHQASVDLEFTLKVPENWLKTQKYYIPKPGELKGFSDQPSFKSREDVRLTPDQYKIFLDFDLQVWDPDNQKFSSYLIPKAPFIFKDGMYIGRFYWLEPKYIRGELKRLLKDLNQGMEHFEDPSKNSDGAILWSIKMSRWLVGIHPFHEGNGQLARYLQDLILTELKMPLSPHEKIGGTLLFEDVQECSNRTEKAISDQLNLLEACLSEYQNLFLGHGQLTENCKSLYPTVSNLSRPDRLEAIIEFVQDSFLNDLDSRSL